VELRIKNYEQLRYLQQLYNDGILTAEEYHEHKQLIITSIRKLWAFIVNYIYIYTWIFDSYMCEIAFEKFIWVQSLSYIILDELSNHDMVLWRYTRKTSKL
jgi:hypothetical protein